MDEKQPINYKKVNNIIVAEYSRKHISKLDAYKKLFKDILGIEVDLYEQTISDLENEVNTSDSKLSKSETSAFKDYASLKQ